MYEYYDAVLHAVTEGLLSPTSTGRLRLANDEASRLLGLPADAVGRPVAELGLSAPLTAALTDDAPREDELHVTVGPGARAQQGPAQWQGRPLGHVATLRDRTDLEALTGELDSARGLTEALRSQAHESANRLHTIVSPHRARATPTARWPSPPRSCRCRSVLTDRVVGCGRRAGPDRAAARQGRPGQRARHRLPDRPGDAAGRRASRPSRDVVTIVGNLIDNAFDAVDPGPERAPGRARRRRVDASRGRRMPCSSVADTGPGLPPGAVDDAFRRGLSTKEQGQRGPPRHRPRPRGAVGRAARRDARGVRAAGRAVHRPAAAEPGGDDR